MHMPTLIVLAAIPLAAIAGFATQRGGICAVAAAKEAFALGRWTHFLTFLECAAWALLFLLAADQLGLATLPENGPATFHLTTLAGAALFGVGAVTNNACAFGTISRIGAGETAFLATIPGILCGAAIAPGAADGPSWTATAFAATEPWASFLGAAVLVFAAVRMWSARTSLLRPRLILRTIRAPSWPTSLAMAMIAAVNTTLQLFVVNWPYTTLLADLGQGSEPVQLGLRAALGAALIAGAVAGGRVSGRLKLRKPPLRQMARCFVGGGLMGVGAALIPGGNDAMVLRELPLATVHGAAAYAIFVFSVFMSLAAVSRAQMVKCQRPAPSQRMDECGPTSPRLPAGGRRSETADPAPPAAD